MYKITVDCYCLFNFFVIVSSKVVPSEAYQDLLALLDLRVLLVASAK